MSASEARSGRLARLLLGVVSLVALAWLALGLLDARRLADGTALAVRPPASLSPSEAAHADGLLRDATLLNPDTEPSVLRAGFLALGGHPREGLALARSVVRREPQNARAWGIVALTARRLDPALATRAQLEIARLSPAVAAPG